MELVLLLFGLPAALVTIDFIKFVITGKRLYGKELIRFVDVIVVVVLPLFYLIFIDININDCCWDSATFSPDHKLTIYVLVALCVIAYLYSSFKKTITSPIVEILVNSLLLGGIVLNIFIAIQINEFII